MFFYDTFIPTTTKNRVSVASIMMHRILKCFYTAHLHDT